MENPLAPYCVDIGRSCGEMAGRAEHTQSTLQRFQLPTTDTDLIVGGCPVKHRMGGSGGEGGG